MPKHSSDSTPTNPSHDPTSSVRKDAPPSSAVPNFLLKLLEACTKHKRRHEREKNDTNKYAAESCDVGKLDWCHSELRSFARILPRMESTISVRNTSCDEYHCSGKSDTLRRDSATATDHVSLEEMNEEDSVGHLCALYRAIARGAFCPHAFHYLFMGGSHVEEGSGGGDFCATNDDIAEGILPRITKLLQYLASDPVRVAFSPLQQRPANQYVLDEEAITKHHQEENIGSTIAALLNLMQDNHLRLCAVLDLMNLSNDLSVIIQSNGLFDPPLTSNGEHDDEDVTKTKTRDSIRVQVFTEVARQLPKRLNERYMVHIPSRRSLLAIQLGVWTALHRFVPKVIGGEAFSQSLNPSEAFSTYGQSAMVDLVNLLLSSSRSTVSVLPRALSHDLQLLGWSYSSVDVAVHSLLILRTKLAVVGLFTDFVAGRGGLIDSRPLFYDVSALTLAPTIDLALMAVEATKYHLLWDGTDSLDDHVGSTTNSQFSSLNSMCSWALSNFLALALLFADTTSTSKNEIWSYCFPPLVDCIPLITVSANNCLREVVLRLIHAILLSSAEVAFKESTHSKSCILDSSHRREYPHQYRTFSAPCFLEHFKNRCLVRGYFSYLFELAQDSAESISGPTVSIISLLLESSSDFPSTIELLENACSVALGVIKPGGHTDLHMVRLGSKRRKLKLHEVGRGIGLSSSIESVFEHAVAHALRDANDLMNKFTEGNNQESHASGGTAVISLVSEPEIDCLRGVAGALRILLSLRKDMMGIEPSPSFTDKTIAIFFDSVEFVCEKLVQQKRDGKLVYIEPNLLYDAVSSIVNIGLHACRGRKSSVANSSAGEAMTNFAFSTLSMIEFGPLCKLRNDASSKMITMANRSKLCGGICCRLASMIGAIARPYSTVCLCGLVGESTSRLAEECGQFVLDVTLPLQCR